MAFSLSSVANLIGTHVLPFTNPRVVAPPGRVSAQGRANILVATPMRSGTHMMIDMILNNLPAYRNTPLYVDLDQCWKQKTATADLVGAVSGEAGYILKTHLPLGVDPGMAEDPHINALIAQAHVVTIHRDRAAVCRSLGRWHGTLEDKEAMADYARQYDMFWAHWDARPQTRVTFDDVFDPAAMGGLLDQLAQKTGVARAPVFRGPPRGRVGTIYKNKALTRLIGRRAPHVDTSIHTIKG